VGGFENFGGTLTGGIMATGNYPAKPARPKNCAPTPRRRCRSSPANTASTCTPFTASSAAEGGSQRNRAKHFKELD